MAKPIRATPKLTREETNKFIARMIKVENSKPSASEKRLAKKLIQDFGC